MLRSKLILLFIVVSVISLNAQTLKAKQKSRVSVDTIYVPIDLSDCLNQLDKIFPDSNKSKIKEMSEEDFSARTHLGFGTWMRNSWGLWKGSRLARFFNEMGIFHPEDMSGIILDSYYRHLKEDSIKFAEQIKYYLDYWENAKREDLKRTNEQYAGYQTGDTVLFNYRGRFASKSQEYKYDNDLCIAKGIIESKNQEKFFIKVKLLDACDKRGIILYTNSGTLVYNKSTGKMRKPKKSVVTYLKAGDSQWFYYNDWELLD